MEKLGVEIKKKMELSFQASNSYIKLYITKIESLQLMHTIIVFHFIFATLASPEGNIFAGFSSDFCIQFSLYSGKFIILNEMNALKIFGLASQYKYINNNLY